MLSEVGRGAVVAGYAVGGRTGEVAPSVLVVRRRARARGACSVRCRLGTGRPRRRADVAGVLAHPAGGARNLAAAVLLAGAVLALRRALFARLVRKPGPVEVTSFTGTPADDRPCEDVLADFRRTLTTMSLSTPQSVPTEPSADTVLEDVKTAADSTTNAVATAAALLKALLQVRSAYRVSAQLRNRSGPKPCGITVHVVTLPGARGEIDTFWADDWLEVAERAAHFVGSFILPRSRLAKGPPWTAWRGLAMPSALFHHSQLARGHVRARRYEEAMVEFHRALKIDPQNPHLRVELAQAQEQLGLYMDALAAYADVVAIESWYDRRLWLRLRTLRHGHSSGSPPSRFARSPNGRQALLIARYRLVCRLAAADELSDQWVRSDPAQPVGDRNRRRAVERAALRQRLTVWLSSSFRLYAKEQLQRTDPSDIDAALRRQLQVRHFLQFVAKREAVDLIRDYRWIKRRRRPGMPVTQTGLKILRVWAPLYLDYAQIRLLNDEAESAGRAALPTPRWPPVPSELDPPAEPHHPAQAAPGPGMAGALQRGVHVGDRSRRHPATGDVSDGRPRVQQGRRVAGRPAPGASGERCGQRLRRDVRAVALDG